MTGLKLNIAILAANGAHERDMAGIARGLNAVNLASKTISPENALLMTWADKGWGISYPVDQKLETSLGSDFDALIVPDGARSVEKLLTNPHCKRFTNVFFLANRPVLVFGAGAELLAKLGLNGDNVLALAEVSPETMAEATAFVKNYEAQIEDEAKAA